MTAHATVNRLRSTLSCAHCGSRLIAPERSAYVNEGLICHEWCCADCELSITTVIRFSPGEITQATLRVSHIPVQQVSA
jgi:hypothetical protein